MANEHIQRFRPHGYATPAFSLDGRESYARVVSVYDGDTMTCVLPLHDTFYKFNIRMYGIDTSEMKSKLGDNKERALAAKRRVLTLLGYPAAKGLTKKEVQAFFEDNVVLVHLRCHEFDKYGRLLARVFLSPEATVTFSDILIQEGLAYAYFGDTKRTEDEQNATLA